ncbi:MAG: thioredoxin [Candidatus Nezhaarchaeales archaeon]
MNYEFDEELERIKEEKMKFLEKKAHEGKVLHLNSATFKDLIRSEARPVLVDFWAEWCAPCRLLSPIIDKLAEKYSGKVIFAKVNVDECPDLAEEFEIMAIPTLVLFVNGNEMERVVGLVPERRIEHLIMKYME